jgi:hypothetical protein
MLLGHFSIVNMCKELKSLRRIKADLSNNEDTNNFSDNQYKVNG